MFNAVLSPLSGFILYVYFCIVLIELFILTTAKVVLNR